MKYGYTYHYTGNLQFTPKTDKAGSRSNATIVAKTPEDALSEIRSRHADHVAEVPFFRDTKETPHAIMVVPYPETENGEEFHDFIMANPPRFFDYATLTPLQRDQVRDRTQTLQDAIRAILDRDGLARRDPSRMHEQSTIEAIARLVEERVNTAAAGRPANVDEMLDAWDSLRTGVGRMLTATADAITEKAAELERRTRTMDEVVKRSIAGTVRKTARPDMPIGPETF